MVALKSITKPQPGAGVELGAVFEGMRREEIPGNPGAVGEPSRSLRHIAVKGKSGPLPRPPRPPAGFESVIGPDERVRILDTDLAPWRMICALRMSGPTGSGAIGTGWIVGPRTIVTAGHCVYSNYFFGGWASTIEVSPGRNGAPIPHPVLSARFSSVDRWIQNEDPDFDIGCIHLSESLPAALGWFAVGALTPAQLEGYLVNVSGYPSDRGMGTEQYHHKNRVLRVSTRRIFYDVDTYGGQSGAPVWIHESEGAPPLVIGIHAYGVGGAPQGLVANSAPRIIPEVLQQIRAWVEADAG